MKTKMNTAITWLLPVLLIIFILEVIAFPFAVGLTYAGRSEQPDHILTYTTNQLVWSDVEGIDQNGIAQLSIFDAEYPNVSADDGKAVMAPGTEGSTIVRLKNDSDNQVDFTAVLYAIKSDSNLPVTVNLATGDFSDTDVPVLPDGVDATQIIRTVSGNVNQNQYTDFDIRWLWDYEIDHQQDAIDVDFGNRSANGQPDNVEVGFYLVVNDDSELYTPQTGEAFNLVFYITLLCLSGGVLLLLVVLKKREKADHE